MNQNAIAGIGNVYSDKILFQAKIHPRTAVGNLEAGKLKTLYEAMQQVMREAGESQADPQKFPDQFLIPHRSDGSHCPRCGGSVEKKTTSGRSGYLCPDCQKQAD